jgi:hypothetical protein
MARRKFPVASDKDRPRDMKSRLVRHFRPVVDAMEQRLLLATYTVPGSASSIQGAILLADADSTNDTINVAAGTYTEQLSIAKASGTLMIVPNPSNAAVTIKSPTTLSTDALGSRNIVTITSGSTVTLSKLTISGPPGAGFDAIDTGIFVEGGSAATIQNDTITNISDNPPDGIQSGVAIQVGQASSSTTGTATISNSIITGYQKNGITVDGIGSSATVTNNTITGAPTSLIAQNGIQVSNGAFGSISGNTISGNQYTGNMGYFATGVLLSQPSNNTIVTGNTINNNDVGINSTGASAKTTLTSNTIAGLSSGIFGIYNSSAGLTVITGNIISGFSNGTGIYSTSTGSSTINSNTIDGNLVGIDSDSSGTTTMNGNTLGSTTPNSATGIEVDESTVNATSDVITGGSIGIDAISYDGNVSLNLGGSTITNATTGIAVDSTPSSYSTTVTVDSPATSPPTTVTSNVNGAHGAVLTGPSSQLIESVPPTVALNANSPVLTNNPSGTFNAVFSFTGHDNITSANDLVYQYQLDGGTPTTTTSPLTLSNLSLGAHTLILTVFDQGGLSGSTTISFSNIPTIGDYGFEAVPVGNSFAIDPSGSAWTFSGVAGNGSGVSGNNSPFTSGNPNAPQGTQVGYIQTMGTITQSVGFAAGTYTISFDAAQRGNFGTSVENFEVLVDSQVVSTFQPTTTTYQAYTTNSFTVTAGTHTIEFLGLNSHGGDNTVFLDVVSAAPVIVTGVSDPGFEQIPVGNGFAIDPSGSAWAFSGVAGNGSGVSGNNSPFTSGNPNAPQGTQVGYIQTMGTITQSVGFAAGTYTISFDAAQRGNFGTSVEDFEVLVDGHVVGTFQPTTTTYLMYTTNSFAVTAGTHTIEFLGLNSHGGDNTAFLDVVSVALVAGAVVGDPGFEQVPVGNGFAINPSGSAWTFSGVAGNGSGVSGNNSPFTSGNPNAPQGTQVGYIEAMGSITQSVTGFSAGNYTISLDAAQRGNFGGIEDFEVLVDGNVVGHFTPASSTYESDTTSIFTVSAGTHVIQLLGIDTATGDNTVFIDDVTIASA